MFYPPGSINENLSTSLDGVSNPPRGVSHDMAGYVIASTACHIPERLAEYNHLMRHSLTKYGGRVLLRGQAAEVMEDDSSRARLIVIEFPTVQRAKLWYNSEDYRRALRILQISGGTNEFLIVEGRSADLFRPILASSS